MKKHTQDWIILVLGVWLLCSPWWLMYFTGRPYIDQLAASYNSIITGLVIAFFAIRTLAVPENWEEWINLALGLWLVASPWALGFHSYTIALVNIVVVGGIISISAAIGLGKLNFIQRHTNKTTMARHGHVMMKR
jgi:hypothetical protein